MCVALQFFKGRGTCKFFSIKGGLFYIYHFHTLDQSDLPVYISHINLWSGIYHDISLNHRDISRYIPDHKLFDAKAALYIACTNSVLIMGLIIKFKLVMRASLLKPIMGDKKTIKEAFWVSI